MSLGVSPAPFGAGWESEAQLAPCLQGLKPSSSAPWSLPTPLSTPYPCLMKEKGIYPSRESPEQEVNFNLRKLFACKWQTPG